MRAKKVIVAGLLLVVGVTALLEAQQRRGRRGGFYGVKRPEHITWNSDFTFCRLAYRRAYDGDGGGLGRRLPARRHEPAHPALRVDKTPVNFDESREPNHVVIQATEPELFKCPFVMITEVGSTFFDEEEAKALRAYLEKGGFMWADDFWGSNAWNHWERELRKVLPASEYPIIDVPMNHSIFHTLVRREALSADSVDRLGVQRHDVRAGLRQRDAPTRAPSSMRRDASSSSSRTTRDFGDSYERESDDPTYFYNFSVEGYAIGINILLYAMTH